MVRPSYVLGGRAMEVVYDPRAAASPTSRAALPRRPTTSEHPLLLDRFLADAIEVDVDAVCDGNE